MPELPEVETTKNTLLPHINKKIITQVNILFPTLRYPIPKNLITLLPQKKLLNITRRGKYLIFHFHCGELIIHLGMSGKIIITKEKIYKKHDHFELCFDSIYMRINDPRRFGCVVFSENYKQHKLIKNLGVEPLNEEFNYQYLQQKAVNKKINIKNFITNNAIVVGIGNIYACESLFAANINPNTTVNNIDIGGYKKLVISIKNILNQAIIMGGTTIQDFKNANNNIGYFTQKLLVYGKENQNCAHCNGKIIRIIQNQRSTFYCSQCQT